MTYSLCFSIPNKLLCMLFCPKSDCYYPLLGVVEQYFWWGGALLERQNSMIYRALNGSKKGARSPHLYFTLKIDFRFD